MDAAINYLIKSGSLLLLFSAVYHLLLRKETFFRSNRFFLISGMLISIVLPLITFTKIIWTAPQSVPARTATEAVAVIVPQLIQKEQPVIDWWVVVSLFYLAGTLFFIGQFILDYYLVRKVLSGRPIRREGKFRIIETTEDLSPFSYFNYIVYNPLQYSETELENILEHEKTHCREYHSADVLFTRLCCIAFWFNPIIWLYKSQITQNLEFIADAEANRRISDRKNYQITLLKVTARENCLAFTNPFYQSLIKKRIVMLNKKQSRKVNLWKYSFVLPVLVMFMLQFQVQVVAQQKDPVFPERIQVQGPFNSFTTEKELMQLSDMLLKQYQAGLQIIALNTDAKNQLTALELRLTDKFGKIIGYKDLSGKPIAAFGLTIKDFGQGRYDFSFGKLGTVEHPKATSGQSGQAAQQTDAQNAQAAGSVAQIQPVAASQSTSDNNQVLHIINGKEYFTDDLEGYVITTDEYILQLMPEDAIREYGEKGRNGALIFKGKSTMVKKQAVAADSNPVKIITLDNGDQAIFMDRTKMKIPDHPIVIFDNSTPELIINDVIYHNPKETISGMDLDRIKSIRLVETINPDTKQKTYSKVLMELK
ncbi:peptidase M56 [Flavobacterium magnum]|uniref:Peptidase M56 n=1 Tax=Flavobacterium magnum TaxID=2162713 RepID=A0A2S0RHX0_9FLAO|nr:M56 family metallopeptidase [Flavobacterium magnum]AWA30721.1 peptidase M56 [Flavobacterium magnum]